MCFDRFRIGTAVVSFIGLIIPAAHAEDTDSADTVFRLTEEKNEVFVDAVDDPVVEGVSCYVSLRRSKPNIGSGPIIGMVEPAQVSIACRQAGPIKFRRPLLQREEVFEKATSPVFKYVRVVRIADPKRKTLTYLTFPENAIAAVAVLNQQIPIK